MRQLTFVLALMGSALLLSPAALAQTQSATLRGVVADSSGAVVPGARVVLTNVDQNRDWKFTTNPAGEYVFVQIPPGNYRLSAEAAGFKTYERPNIVLQVAQMAELNISLEVGAISEKMEVTAEAPLLDSVSSSLGEVVNGLSTQALPLNGRNVLQLVALSPGITTTSASRTANIGTGSIPAINFSANGGRNETSEVLVDGSSQIVMGMNQAAYIPTPDAVQEFKIQTNSLSAEYGRTGGAVINIVHRSGTKDFHGTLYDFLRNDKFDANDFFSNRNGMPKPAFRFNQFGFTSGGPLTPSRSSTFYFVSYEGVREVKPGSSTRTVPTMKMRQGDFSEVGNIYDPATIDASGRRQPFPNNQIPSSRFNPVAAKLLQYYPQPNLPGVANNFFSQAGPADVISSQVGPHNSSNDISVKIDRRISDRQNLFGRFSWNDQDVALTNFFDNLASPDAGTWGFRQRSLTLDDTYMLGGWVLHGNAGYAYAANPRDSESNGFDLTTLGLPASVASAQQIRLFPYVSPAGYAPLGPSSGLIIHNRFHTYNWTGDATRLIGGHTLKLGGNYRLNRASNYRPISPGPTFNFSQAWTRPEFNGNTGGDAIASMLLGLMSGGSLRTEPALSDQVIYGALYVQDDWHVNSRMTLNLGLRWDSDRPFTERYNRTSWFDPTVALPLQVPGVAPLRGGLVFAGRDGNPRGNNNPDNNNFAPRVGLAYKLTNDLVVRTGFGIFYNPTTGQAPSSGTTGALSFDSQTDVISSIDAGRTPFTTLSNPFPNSFNVPTNGAQGPLTMIGQSISDVLRGDRASYNMQWNFDVQYGLKQDMLLDVAYAGNSGVKLMAAPQWNQLADQYLALGDQLTAKVANPFYGFIPTTSTLGQATTTLGQLLRPYPQLTGLQQLRDMMAHSTYHSLQIKFRKRYRNGLQFLAAYTWSKMIDDASGLAAGFTNNNDRRLDRSLSSSDIPHHLVFNYQYELPFGAGRRFLSQGKLLDAVFGGWRLNGITTIQSGPPVPIFSAANTTNSFGGVQRPNSAGISSETPGGAKDRIDHFFNTAAFLIPPKYAFGNVGRYLPDNRAPGLQNWDLSVLKDIPIQESRRLEFRAEFFNLFNNVNFGGPATVFGQPQFGTIRQTEPARIIQFALKFFY